MCNFVRIENMDLKIRRITPDDINETAEMIIKTIKVSNSKDYSEDLIDALVNAHSPEFLLRRTQWTHFYIALDGTTIIGCGAIGPYWDSETESSLFTIFVMPEYQKCGVGRGIIETLESDEYYIRANRVEIPASITGVPFYQKMGYTFKNGISEPDEEHIIRMEKKK